MRAVKIRKYLLWVAVFSFCLYFAETSPAETDEFGNGFNTAFTLGSGYRSDDLDWNIAGDISGNNPNVLSELTWEDLGIFQVKLDNVSIFRGIYFRGAVAYGWIMTGDVQDSDYYGNQTIPPTGPFAGLDSTLKPNGLDLGSEQILFFECRMKRSILKNSLSR